MMYRIIGLSVTFLFGFVCLYLSRFWIFSLWSRSDFGGFFSPRGGLLSTWLRDFGGRDLAAFELLIWVIIFFLLLTLLERIFSYFSGS